MPRLLLLCFSIVAAFHTPAAAAPSLVQSPIVPVVAALGERLGLDTARDRGRFVPELIRRIYSPPPNRQPALGFSLPAQSTATNRLSAARLTGLPLVDLPLPPSSWSTLLKRQLTDDDVLTAILADRRAALLCRGLYAADDETLAYYAEHPALLAFIYERSAPAFAAFADAFHVHNGRLVVPGGRPAEHLWESLLHVSATDPDAVIRALLAEPAARFGYLYDVLSTASPESRAFALGLWIENEGTRVQRFTALATAAATSFREWHVDEFPFARPLNDLAMMLLRMSFRPDGEPTEPAQRQFWAQTFGANPGVDAAGTQPSHALVDAAWLLQATAGDMYARGDRLEQLTFAQRVFGKSPGPEFTEVSEIVREMPTRRMLLLGLERLGVTTPALYAAALKQTRAVLDGGPNQFWTVAQHQAAVALIARMVSASFVSPRDGEALLASLFAVPLEENHFRGALAKWLETSLAPRLPRGTTWEERLIAAVAGGPTPATPQAEWEGLSYRLDLAFAERRRMSAIRERQGGPDLDTALTLTALARQTAGAASADDARSVLAALQELLRVAGPLLARPPVNALAQGVPVPRDGREWLTRGVEDIERGVRTNDTRRVNRAGESLRELSDIALGHALLSFVYAVHLGDPEGPALLGANVALRHDFGFSRRDGEGRSRGPWSLPRQDFQPGVPWHVYGSLVGLDVALAPLALKRIRTDGLADPPSLQSIEREAFAVNVALLDGRRLRDVDRDRIVAAIAAGRARVKALALDSADFEKLKEELALDGWRTRNLVWVLQNDPRSVENLFSLAEFLRLGSNGLTFDSWGPSALQTVGCICTRMPSPRAWRIVAGRFQVAMLAATTAEMNLELAQRLSVLRLPAALLPSILQTAMQDFVDKVATADPNDSMPVITYPRSLTRDLMADYVASTATLDGPLVQTDREDDER